MSAARNTGSTFLPVGRIAASLRQHRNPAVAVYVVLVVVCLLGLLLSPGFGTATNIINLLFAVSYLGIVTIGMTYVTLSGSFVDLSVGAIAAAAAIATVLLLPQGLLLAVLVGLLVGLVVGAVNGALVGHMRVNPVITTLATASVTTGVILTVSRGEQAYARHDAFTSFGDLRPLGVPISVFILLFVVVVAHLHLSKTLFGRRLTGTGMNFEAMRLAGLRPGRVRAAALAFAGLAAALAGILLVASTESATSSLGATFAFDAITAVVVGGVLLTGGRGSVLGALGGVLLIGVLNNLMVLNGVAFPYQQVIKGAILLAAVALQVLALRRSRSGG